MRFHIYKGAFGLTLLSLFGSAFVLIGIIFLVAGIFGEAGRVGEWLPGSLILIALGIFLKWLEIRIAIKKGNDK